MTNSNITLSALDGNLQKGIVGKKTDIQNPELWNFPMDYPMSIIGHEGQHDTLLTEVIDILTSQFSTFDAESIAVKMSRTGRFCSLKCQVTFTEAEQVNQLYASLDQAQTVRMVL